MESRYRHLLPSFEWSRSRHPSNFPVSMSLGLNIPEISQSRWVSVSTSKKFLSLDESRSRHPTYIPVSMSLSLDIHKLLKYSWVIEPKKAAKQSESLDGVSVSSFAQSRNWDSDFLVSVSSIRLGRFQSRSQSCHWDLDIFSLGFIIKTRTFSVSVLVSPLRLIPFQSRSCHWDSDIFSLGLGLDDQNLVSLMPVWYSVIELA